MFISPVLLLGVETGNRTDDATQDDSDNPPRLGFDLPKLSDIPEVCEKGWNDFELPVDILLLTVTDCEFLACFSYLAQPFKGYHKDIGYVYFGSMGTDNVNKLKIALMKCSSGSPVLGGSSSVVINAGRELGPKAVFCVGACSGLYCEKTKLGDVVVSSKLTAFAHKTPASKNVSYLVRHAADGWNPPLKEPDVQEVKVHCDGEVLYRPEAVSEDIIQRHPEAIAVEMKGEGETLNLFMKKDSY